jgi:hypothetical protein
MISFEFKDRLEIKFHQRQQLPCHVTIYENHGSMVHIKDKMFGQEIMLKFIDGICHGEVQPQCCST